jgi:hypothetical protein
METGISANGRVDRSVRPAPPGTANDRDGKPVVTCCENCDHIYYDSDGPEYGPPWPRCGKKPHMENLKAFPFSTPQHCFEIAWWHMVDWEAEGRKLNERPNAGGKRSDD